MAVIFCKTVQQSTCSARVVLQAGVIFCQLAERHLSFIQPSKIRAGLERPVARRAAELWEYQASFAGEQKQAAEAAITEQNQKQDSTMSAPGEYGGVSTSDETLQSTFSSTCARLQAHAAKLKKSILEGTVELATLGTIGAVLMVSCRRRPFSGTSRG